MKKHFVCMALVCAMVLFGAGMSLAGNGNGYGNGSGSGNGAGDGTGPIHDIYSGEKNTVIGDVVECTAGSSLTLSTTDGDVILYGIGPDYYWEEQGVMRPVVGDTITVTYYAVDYNGTLRNIVTSITIGEETVELRGDDGKPLWRGTNGKSAGYGRS